MSKPENIHSLTELRQRKEALRAEESTAITGLTNTLASTPEKAKDYALEDLALPVMGGGLALYVGYRLLRSGKKKKKKQAKRARQADNVYQQQPFATDTYERPAAAFSPPPAPVRPAPRPAPAPVPRASSAKQAAKSGLTFATILSAGKLLVPVVQTIVGIVQNQQTGKQIDLAKDQVAVSKQEVAAERAS